MELRQVNHIKSAKTNISVVIILGILTGIGPLSMDMYLPALPALTKDFHATTSLTQLSITACLIGMASGQLFIGPISDIKGRRAPLLISLLIYCITSILCAFAPNIWLLITLRFIQGLSGSAGIVISRAAMRDLYTGYELTKYFALLSLINGAAPIIAPVFGGIVLNFQSWHWIFIYLGIISLGMVFLVFIRLEESLPTKNRLNGGIRGTLQTYGNLFKNTYFMSYVITQSFIFAAMFAYISGSSFVLQSVFQLTPQQFSFVFASNGIGIIIASQLTGRFASRIPESKLFVFGILFANIGSILIFIASTIYISLPLILIGLFIIVSCVGIVSTSGFPLIMHGQEKNAGTAAALSGAFSSIVGAFVAPFVGLGGSNSSLSLAIIIFICELLALIIYLLFIKGKKV